MHRTVRALAVSAFFAAAFLLGGCGAILQQQKAIENAVVAYADYYIEVRDLGAQVRAQAKLADPDANVWDCTISAEIPNYPELSLDALHFTLPTPDYSVSGGAAAYRQTCVQSLRQALETYALDHPFDTYVVLPLTFTLSQSGRGWLATLSSTSRNEIAGAVESLVLDVLNSDEAYLENSRFAAVADAKTDLLAPNFGGADYAALANVTGVTPLGGGAYSLQLSFPDPAALYGALGEHYVSSFNQPFFGDERAVSLDAGDLTDVDTSAFPLDQASVTVSYDEAAGTASVIDSTALDAMIAPAKAAAEADAAARVNTTWRVPALEAPDSGKVLEGESGGNEIVFVTSENLGKYYYVRFYRLTGQDVSEHGTLAVGVFIDGGRKASVRLPSGYYRIACMVGNAWYGLDYLFGSDGKTYDGSNAVQSRSGYINTVSFG